MTIIEQLKDNEKPFGLMSEEMQAEARRIGSEHFELWEHSGQWRKLKAERHLACSLAYCLHPDYEDEPEIVECEIYRSRHGNFYIDVYDFEDDAKVEIDMIPVGYIRIGFKFADGTVMGSPIKYSVPGITSHGYYASYEDLKTSQALEHHACHVLFRRKKQE